MTLFLDMDGVLADFDTGYENAFGIRPSKADDNVDWRAVRDTPDFYLNLPPMPDLYALWNTVRRLHPIVLTGIPDTVEEALDNKLAWVRRYLGQTIEVRGCASKDKCLHATPGDVLIDDWEKYRDRWIDAGGIWITHKSAAKTVTALLLMQEVGTIRL